MKKLLLAFAVIALGAGAETTANSQEALRRNPFWPIGYEGKRESITAEVRIAPKKIEEMKKEREAETARSRMAAVAAAAEAEAAARAEAEARERIVRPEQWVEAQKSLRVGGRINVKSPDGQVVSGVVINGKTYCDGDLISFTHGKNRFTWRVRRLTDGKTVRLARIGARHIGDVESENGKSEKAGSSAKGAGK